MIINRTLLTSLVALAASGISFAQSPEAPASSPAEASVLPVLAKPSPQQLAFADMELGAFFHYDLNTYSGQEHGDGFEPPTIFKPTALDAEQWVRTAKAMGAKYAVLTARHEGGFCLWPTKTTEYSIKNSPYKNGKGDLVREFVDACRKYDIKPCLYHTATFDAHSTFKPEDKGKLVWGNDGLMGKRFKEMGPEGRTKFREKQVAQMTELLTQYGDITYIWCDHWNGKDGTWRAVLDTMRRLQPNCIMMGPDTTTPGNESGYVSYPLWNAINTLDGTINSRGMATAVNASAKHEYGLLETDVQTGHPLGKFWRNREAPTNVGFAKGGWFWHPGKTVPRTLAEHVELYYRTVGLGANLIINLPPDDRGLIQDDMVAAAEKFGQEIRSRFQQPIAESKQVQAGDTIELSWPKACRIDHVVLRENIVNGQKIVSYALEAWVNGEWQALKPMNVFSKVKPPYNSNPGFETVGAKKIDRIEPVVTQKIRFRCLKSVVAPVELRQIAVYNVDGAK